MLRRRLVFSAVISALPLALVACGEKKQSDPRTEAPLVRAATIQGAVVASRTFTGTVAARVQSDLGFRVSGKVLERLVDTGQTVKRGQALMRIDPVDLRLAATCPAGSGRRRPGARAANGGGRSPLPRPARNRRDIGFSLRSGQGCGGCRQSPAQCGRSPGRSRP